MVGPTADAATARPNFVVVITDDQGPWAMPNRMPELHMPHLQAMLDESLEFTRAYCASPVCSPARASIYTGRTPSAHGVHDWLVGGRHPQAHPDLYLDGQPTTAESLAGGGYQCGLSGKWHVGDSRRPAPGMEYWYAHQFGGGPYRDAPIWRDGEPTTEPRYLTEAITDQAIDFLHQRDPARPFHLTVTYTAPHTPWIDQHPERLLRWYDGCDFPSVPRDEPHPWTPEDDSFADARADPVPHLAGYCAALTGVDEGLGRIRATLDELGVASNTIIVFLSDNGFSCGHRGIWGKGNGTHPLNFHDNSVRVPFVVHVPDGPRGTTDTMISTRALHHTICELAGVVPDEDRWSPAESVAPVLRDGTAAADPFVVVTGEYGQGRMITDGRYVLVTRSAGPDEFYDHDTDPLEAENLIDSPTHREVIEQLRGRLREWFDRWSRPGQDAYHLPVSGKGQIHPTSRGLPPEQSYVPREQDGPDT